MAPESGKKPEKRPRDDNDYEADSDYFHNVFHTDWATEKKLTDQDAIMQERVAQEQAKEDWQANHDRLFGPNKKPGGRATAPEPESPADIPATTDEDPETRRRNEEIDRVFNPVVERFRRIESVKRRPAATNTGKKSGQPGKKVTFAVDVLGPYDAHAERKKAVLLSPTLHTTEQVTTTTTPATTDTPAERFPPHPALPRTDQDFEEAICILKQMMREWSQEYFYNRLSDAEKRDFNLYRLAQGSPQLMKHAAWIAAGGDLEKWKSHFVGNRASLVFGILGKMLEVEVFGHTMFGATPSQLATLASMDLALLNVDGFKRTRVRSRMIQTLLDRAPVPPHFDAQVQELTIRFFTMIAPLIPQSVAATLWIPTTTRRPFLPSSTNTATAPPTPRANPLLSSLWAIIDHAAKTSLDMRREETIYYVNAPAKGSVFEDEGMACMNKGQIKRGSPWKEDEEVPLVRIVGFPGVVAYRAGNGREGGEEEGLRCRRVARAEVVLEWGVERGAGGVGEGKVVGNGNGNGKGNGNGHKNGNGNGNGNGDGNGNGSRELTLKEAIAKSKASAYWVYGLLDWITYWAS